MPESCGVVGCTVRRGPDSRKAGIRLFRIPTCPRKRAAWTRSISRKHWEPKNWDRVRGRHFVSGAPSDDPDNVDYRPTLFMKGQDGQCLQSPTTMRQERASKRQRDSHMRELSEVIYVSHSDLFHGTAVYVTVDFLCCTVFWECVESRWRKTEYDHYSLVMIAVVCLF